MAGRPCFVLISADGWAWGRGWAEVAAALLESGAEVIAAVPDDLERSALDGSGVEVWTLPLQRGGLGRAAATASLAGRLGTAPVAVVHALDDAAAPVALATAALRPEASILLNVSRAESRTLAGLRLKAAHSLARRTWLVAGWGATAAALASRGHDESRIARLDGGLGVAIEERDAPEGARARARTALGIAEARHVVVVGASGGATQAADALARAAALAARRPDVRALVVAIDAAQPAARAGAPRGIRVVTSEAEVDAALAAADLLVCHDASDAGALVLAAAARRTPSVVPETSPLAELVRDGETGRVARAGGDDQAVTELLDDAAGRALLGAAARSRARAGYSRPVAVERVLRLYARALGSDPVQLGADGALRPASASTERRAHDLLGRRAR
jgi:glycosyltransferase involved in cell wall biosynthesis